MSSRPRAFTVIELLVYIGILSLLLSGLYLLLMGGLDSVKTGAAYQTAQQQALLGMTWLRKELANSTLIRRSPVLGPASNSNHIIFLSPDPVGGGAWTYAGSQLYYHKYVCFYWDSATDEIIRTEQALPSPELSTTAPPPPDLLTMQAIVDPDRRVVAKKIKDLRINEGVTPEMIIFELAGEEATTAGRVTRVAYRTQVRMENR